MSTFYGGEQLLNVLVITNPSAGVKYTVPSGRYAVAELIEMGDGSIVSFGTTAIEIQSGNRIEMGVVYSTVTKVSGSNGRKISKEIILNSGEEISLSNSTSGFRVQIKEYKKP